MRIVYAAALCLAACGGEPTDPPAKSSGGGGVGGSGGAPASVAGAELPCAGGELQLSDESCAPPGVPVDGCSAGFVHDDGACSAVLPTSGCAPGSYAIVGDAACRRFDDCGSDTWGSIPVDGSTQHVDASHVGTSDGSAGAPYTTIQAAVDAASDDAIVAVAAGTYVEDLVIDHPVALWGVCAGSVSIVGTSAPALSATAAIEIHGVALTGAQQGARLDQATSVLMRDVWIHDTGAAGIDVIGVTALRLEASLLENTTEFGVSAYVGDVDVSESAIRDVAPNAGGDWGVALLAYGATSDKQNITVRRSVVERTRSFGIVVQQAVDTVIEDSVIRDVDVSEALGADGFAVWQHWLDTDGPRATLSVRGSVFERLHATGIGVWGGDATIERTTVRDISPPLTAGEWGAGIRFFSNGADSSPPTGVVRESTVDEAHRVGIELWAAEAEVERVLVRDPRPKTNGEHGFGIIAFDHDETLVASGLTLRGARIERASQGGLVISGSTADVDSVAVLDTQPTATGSFGVAVSVLTNWQTGGRGSAEMRRVLVDGAYASGVVVGGGDLVLTDTVVRNVKKQLNVDDFGDGIGASSSIVWLPGIIPTSLSVTRATVEGVPRAGISSFGATVDVGGSLLECNAIDLDGEYVDDTEFTFDDGGDNSCGCAADRAECKVLTTSIAPPISL